MADQQVIQPTQEDVRSLADKLAEFGKALAPGEQALLGKMIHRRTPEQNDDVQGYQYVDVWAPWTGWQEYWVPDRIYNDCLDLYSYFSGN